MNADKERKLTEELMKTYKINKEVNEQAWIEISKVMYFRYQTYIEVGFTETQAFELVKYRGVT